MVTKVYTTVCIASIGAQSLTSTRSISVPFMTNSKDVLQGEELICELVVRAKPKKVTKRAWQDVAREEERQIKEARKKES